MRLRLLLAALLLPLAARADVVPLSAAQQAVLAAPDTRTLRTSLAALVDSARAGTATQRANAGEAAALLARLATRRGDAVEAANWARTASTIRGNYDDHVLFAEALFATHRREDLDEAIRHLSSDRVRQSTENPRRVALFQAQSAWARWLLGDSGGVALALAGREDLEDGATWSRRLGRMALSAGRRGLAYDLLFPLAERSRGMDEDAMALLKDAVAGGSGALRLSSTLEKRIAAADTVVGRAVRAFGGRRVRFRAADGFPLSGSIVTRASARRPAAIVVVPAEDSLAWYDSLSVHLQRAGYKVLLLDPRGSRWSVDSGAPSPEWALGHEDEIDSLAASDVRASLRALALSTPTDTTRYLVVGVGSTATIAAEVARRDRRVACVMLVAPWPEPALRGVLRGTLATAARPVFVQIGPEEIVSNPYAQLVADAVPARLVRVADSASPGRGARLFRAGPEVSRRFLEWWAWVSARRPAASR